MVNSGKMLSTTYVRFGRISLADPSPTHFLPTSVTVGLVTSDGYISAALPRIAGLIYGEVDIHQNLPITYLPMQSMGWVVWSSLGLKARRLHFHVPTGSLAIFKAYTLFSLMSRGWRLAATRVGTAGSGFTRTSSTPATSPSASSTHLNQTSRWWIQVR